MCVREEGGRAAKDAMTLKEIKESTEELLQCKRQYICTPHSTLSPAAHGDV